MGVLFGLSRPDRYVRTAGHALYIVNDGEYFSSDGIERLKDQMMTQYHNDTIDTIPKCSCGTLKGELYHGEYCSKCGTNCTSVLDHTRPILWLRAFKDDNGEIIKFINPHIWLMLSMMLDTKTDYLYWLASKKARLPNENIPPVVKRLEEIIGGRGYSNVINNIASILKFLKTQTKFKPLVSELVHFEKILEYYETTSEYIPMINKRMFVMEHSEKGKYTNFVVGETKDIVMSWSKFSSESISSREKIENITAKTMTKLANMYFGYISKYLAKKPGIFRKNVYGARTPFAFRTVITAIAGPHAHDEIRIPWSVGVTLLKPMILNRLINKHDFVYKEAIYLWTKSINNYSELIDEIISELIHEAPGHALHFLMQRNPSLFQGSILKCRALFIKKDPSDKTTSISPLAASSMNADFDGDAINFKYLEDGLMIEMAEVFSPFYNIPGLNSPYGITGNLTLLPVANRILQEFLGSPEEDPANDTIAHLLMGGNDEDSSKRG